MQGRGRKSKAKGVIPYLQALVIPWASVPAIPVMMPPLVSGACFT